MTRHRIASHPSRRTLRIARLAVEPLELRALLSAVDAIVPAVGSIIADQGWNNAGGQQKGGLTNPSPSSTAMTPAEILSAYGFSTSSTAGKGTTIAIVDAYNDPNIQADLAKFDAQYGLAPASLTVMDQDGGTNLPATDPSWSLEISLDVEWAHAVAPGANIVLVEANSSSITDLMTAVHTAAQHADVVSMSWGGGEFYGQQYYDSPYYFGNPNVTFVAASGDDGGFYGAEWPASSPDVLAVGGTTLSLNAAGGYGRETAWNASWSWGRGGFSFSGSTGGVSQIEPLPSYQAAALGSYYASGRVVPDVSMDAAPSSGLAVFDSVAGLGQSGWFQVGGTSAGSPIWSGLVANADQARGSSLSSTDTLNLLYGLYGAGSYSGAFHDVTSGRNFAGRATSGYDIVTGLGSPYAGAIIGAASTASFAAAPASQSVVQVVTIRGVQDHAQADAPDRVVLITAAEIRFLATALAALPRSPAPFGAAQPVHFSGTEVDAVVAAGLPNQPILASARPAAGLDLMGAAPTVYNGSDVVSGAPVAQPAVPGPGDFHAPPILDPATPFGVWDEALAAVAAERGPILSEPRAFAPWTGCDVVAGEDLAESAPTLLGAAALVVVFGMSWNRRLAEEDRRLRTFGFPSPSLN